GSAGKRAGGAGASRAGAGGDRAAPAFRPSRAEAERLVGARLRPAVPRRLRSVSDLAGHPRLPDELVQLELDRQRHRRVHGSRQLPRGPDRPELLVLPWQHGALHGVEHAPAGRDPVVPRAAREPGAARAVVLPSGLFRPLLAAGLGRDADLELDLPAGIRPDQQLPDPDRAERSQLAARCRRRDDLRRHRHRLVDARLQLRPLPGRAAGNPARCLRGGRPRRRDRLRAGPLDHDPAPGADDGADRGPPDPRLAQGLRPDLLADGRRAQLLDPADHPVRLRARLHDLPGRLRLGDVVRLLPLDPRHLARPVRVDSAAKGGRPWL
ncbi:MAG: ABC transporter, permease protein 1 (cluster 1, maltose/g3p/polyamine/iron), partial [uncultured Thermomicrobiales bacterium]